ncbi:hypothetical protein PENARI_c255G02098 [Penicillium arizonense]|uniref:Uncharacterized protein n=1 Tax=Penicillium arizonense TaxID=1835702 RepID=A0A1F5L0C4_PENAI|nr:hypothetical protein PENARI_c255G02098 [Penicillium arizonense]OGE46449.1 hypothetical protein PENARI_c255G02098 [Penicillium arizonense]
MAYTPFLARSLQIMQHVLKFRKPGLWVNNRTHKPQTFVVHDEEQPIINLENCCGE